jgi:hypothetical protein
MHTILHITTKITAAQNVYVKYSPFQKITIIFRFEKHI